jgi:hypothetical protein
VRRRRPDPKRSVHHGAIGFKLSCDQRECLSSDSQPIGAQKATILEEHETSMDRRGSRELGEVVDVGRDGNAILLKSTGEDIDIRRLQKSAVAEVTTSMPFQACVTAIAVRFSSRRRFG